MYGLFIKERAIGKGAISAREKVQQWKITFIQNIIKDGVENNNNEEYSLQSPSKRTSQTNLQLGVSSIDNKRKIVDVFAK